MDALGINLPGLVTQVVSFVILFAILYKLLYNPVLRMLDQRSDRIREGLEAAQQARDEAAQSSQEVERQIDLARAEGTQLVAQAREVADRFREDELAKVRTEIEAERNRAQANIQRERDAAIEELRREFAGMAIDAAERIINTSLDESIHRQVIEQVLDESARIQQN